MQLQAVGVAGVQVIGDLLQSGLIADAEGIGIDAAGCFDPSAGKELSGVCYHSADLLGGFGAADDPEKKIGRRGAGAASDPTGSPGITLEFIDLKPVIIAAVIGAGAVDLEPIQAG